MRLAQVHPCHFFNNRINEVKLKIGILQGVNIALVNHGFSNKLMDSTGQYQVQKLVLHDLNGMKTV